MAVLLVRLGPLAALYGIARMYRNEAEKKETMKLGVQPN